MLVLDGTEDSDDKDEDDAFFDSRYGAQNEEKMLF